MILTPIIYATGFWKAKLPFIIDEHTIYTCSAIHSFESLRSNGIDPYQQFYVPLKISFKEFQKDELNKVTIVTLTSKYARTINIPDSYLLQYPRDTRIPYTHQVISISLGALPDQLPIEFLKDSIEFLILQKIGVKADIKFHTASVLKEPVKIEDHELFEKIRKKRIKNNETPDVKIKALKEENTQLKETIRILETLLLEKI